MGGDSRALIEELLWGEENVPAPIPGSVEEERWDERIRR